MEYRASLKLDYHISHELYLSLKDINLHEIKALSPFAYVIL